MSDEKKWKYVSAQCPSCETEIRLVMPVDEEEVNLDCPVCKCWDLDLIHVSEPRTRNGARGAYII